jgi:adenosine deaminase
MTQLFKDYLLEHSISGLSSIPKSDLHSHAGRGGNVGYIAKCANVIIAPPPTSFESLLDMQSWYEMNIKKHCTYLKRLEAAFVQACNDNIAVLAMSFDITETCSIGYKNIESFIEILDNINIQFAPSTLFLPELTFDRACDVDSAYAQLDEILSYNWFKSIDICCNEFSQPIKNFKKIFEKAKKVGLRLKAHVGEYGTADDVMGAVEVLELDEVHHGIAVASSPQIMKWLAEHKIQLNVCPTSNVMLGLVDSYEKHPIRKLFDYGIPVTINSDDLLIFNQSVSQEYFNLFKCGLMTVDELNLIRESGLKEADNYAV